MGFLPLGAVESEKSEFSYVGDERPRSGRSDSIFDDYKSSSNLTLASSFSEKMKAQKLAEQSESEIIPEKKVASYYLEVETLERMKEWADEKKATYSSVVEAAIRSHLSALGA